MDELDKISKAVHDWDSKADKTSKAVKIGVWSYRKDSSVFVANIQNEARWNSQRKHCS